MAKDQQPTIGIGKPTPLTMLKVRRSKIIATIGPASSEPDMIRQLIETGVNVFRLNMSHGEHSGHAENFSRIRSIAASLGQPVAILADLCGPKIRTGNFRDGNIELIAGEKTILTMRDVQGEPGLIPSQYRELAR
ncbi:MAG: pyruvate kinase, partial [Mariprofundaceae bacterium]|nr:pyruvate kinase [Mariprofundaceae bacterium]